MAVLRVDDIRVTDGVEATSHERPTAEHVNVLPRENLSFGSGRPDDGAKLDEKKEDGHGNIVTGLAAKQEFGNATEMKADDFRAGSLTLNNCSKRICTAMTKSFEAIR